MQSLWPERNFCFRLSRNNFAYIDLAGLTFGFGALSPSICFLSRLLPSLCFKLFFSLPLPVFPTLFTQNLYDCEAGSQTQWLS